MVNFSRKEQTTGIPRGFSKKEFIDTDLIKVYDASVTSTI